jgi:hypothetical protein
MATMSDLWREIEAISAEVQSIPGAAQWKVDLVNLDRGGKSSLVYLNGAIVRRGDDLLDGRPHNKANAESDRSVQKGIVQLPLKAPDPIPGAIYISAGHTPDYLVDSSSRTILIGDTRGDMDATRDEVRIAARKAIKEALGE